MLSAKEKYVKRTAILLLILALLGTMSGQQFSHVIYIIQENRTPDNLFGSNPTFEPGVDIATSGFNSKRQNVPLTPVPLGGCYDLGHGRNAYVVEYNKGAMNGFDKDGAAGKPGCVIGANPAYRYVDNSTGTVQPYFDLAKQYGFANRMFQTNQGPSFPAHQFLISGTSAPTDTSNLFIANNPTGGSGMFAGCASSPTTVVQMIDPNGVFSNLFPCYHRSTLIDLIEQSGLTWRYYAPNANSIWNAPNAVDKLCNAATVKGKLTCTGAEWSNVVLNPTAVLTDLADCHLTSVSWVIPSGQNSDHGNISTGGGPSWVASIVNAVGNSKCGYWQNTAILITWDDWGGWYDHVSPPPALSSGWGVSNVYGFRVPLIVVSAYTPASYVGNNTHDFGSMLRFTEKTFGLGLIGPGTWADSYADDLMEFFPLSSPRVFSPTAAKFDAAHFINDNTPATDPDDD